MYRNSYSGGGGASYGGGYNNNSYGGGSGGYGNGRDTDWGSRLAAVDWKAAGIPEVNWPKDKVTSTTLERSAADVEKWRKEFNISAFSDDVPKPILTFKETPYPNFVLDSFARQGFSAPTPVQCQAWGIALLNRDVVGIAKTGSGKTLAFLCPGIVHIMSQAPLKYRDGPIMLVLAPTRELAKQIEDEAMKVLGGSQLKTVCAYGGTPKGQQMRQFDQGAHIAICCPGRLLDLLAVSATNLKRVSYFVMDEADRMLDMGFEPQITSICTQLRPDRQTLMFSATWPKEIQAIANTYLKNFVRIHIGSQELQVNPDVTQHIQILDDNAKFDAMLRILERKKDGKVIIFVATKSDADIICRRLCHEKFSAWAIHGDRTQQVRDACLAQFRHAKQAILVATDVAQRGLDVRDLDTVINYDFPNAVEDYVHRVGRTGRAGAKGEAYTFMNAKHSRMVPELIQLLTRTNSVVPPELYELQRMGSRYGGGGRGFGGRGRGSSYGSSYGGGGYGGGAMNRYPSAGGYNSNPYAQPVHSTYRGGAMMNTYGAAPQVPATYQNPYQNTHTAPAAASSTAVSSHAVKRSRSRSPKDSRVRKHRESISPNRRRKSQSPTRRRETSRRRSNSPVSKKYR